MEEKIEQKEKAVTLDSVDLLTLLGLHDENLKPIEQRFNANITVRGNSVFIKGVDTEVEVIEKVFKRDDICFEYYRTASIVRC